MTNFWTAYTGILIGLVLIFSGIMLSFCGGIALDAMSDAFIGAGLDQGVGTAYDSSGEISLLSNLFYVLCYALPLLGIGIMYITITRRMRYDQQQQVYFDENDY
ncbi:MAG: hypothetical protein BWX50_00737 [Euryarchaeota archaeon ADurb.Bin009]|jgi:hypothetical protein|nr:MAG: hypothetical protein BWX50_00737 [Euryarchaeota archaeon ADurb.Bin009]